MQDGHRVTVVDNFLTGSPTNVEHWTGNCRFNLSNHDVSLPIYNEDHVDEIYHLASPASPIHYMRHPIDTIKTNVIGTLNLLDPTVHPQPESYNGNVNIVGPRSCYDEAKRLGETLAYEHANKYGLDVKIARIFNTYGPRMRLDDGRAVSNFIIQALANKTITNNCSFVLHNSSNPTDQINGSGNQTRSFQYISDLVEGLVGLMASNYSMPVNLGNPVELCIGQLAKMVVKLAGNSSSSIEHGPALVDDPQRRRPNIDLARSLLAWHPRVSLEEGLGHTMDYFRNLVPRSN